MFPEIKYDLQTDTLKHWCFSPIPLNLFLQNSAWITSGRLKWIRSPNPDHKWFDIKSYLKFWTSQCLSSRDSIFIYLLLFRVSACDYQWTLVTITLWEINVHFCCLQRAKFISAFYCYYKAAMHSEPSLMCSKFILCL